MKIPSTLSVAVIEAVEYYQEKIVQCNIAQKNVKDYALLRQRAEQSRDSAWHTMQEAIRASATLDED